MRQLTVEKNDAGQRLDKFLQKSMPALPPALMYKYLRQKRVRCNGTQVTNGALRLQQGDVLCLYIRDEFFARNVGTDALARLHPQLQILYEDDNLLLVEKPAGQLVLRALELEPVVYGHLCLGEGTGTITLVPLLDMALALYREMSSFQEFNMDAYVPLT